MRLPDGDESRAVLIGTASYAADSGFKSFPSVGRSLHDFAEFLSGTTGLSRITIVADPPDPMSFPVALSEAADAATDLLLFYYVGHGVAVNDELHLTHSGSRAAYAAFTTVSYPNLRAIIKASPAKVKIVILDCCHSGKAFGASVLAGSEVLAEAVDIDGAFVLTATDEKTKFAAAQDDSGRTAFTGTLLNILTAGVPTADRYLTMSALFQELRDRLPASNLPKPKALERGTAAELALARNVAWAGAAPPPVLPGTETAAYFAQVRDIAPPPPNGLVDRDAEMTELRAFCDGDEPYLWWRAGPWAGKTALMSWFALHPPEHVRVVSFFITSRLASQSDHVAFTNAALEQLCELLPSERATVAAAVGNRDALRRHLLDLAAQRAVESGCRILLLVDGLDEDQGKPSIASLLPNNPGPGLRVVVASRPNPPIPLDVPPKHPLRTCRRRELARSEWADGMRDSARMELSLLLNGEARARDVLGLVTAAGGLTDPELAELTRLAPFEIENILGRVTGRTFRTRLSEFVPDKINLLAHETLQAEAERAMGNALLGRYRDEIHAWAERYRDAGWPEQTPTYLLARYFSKLKAQDDLPRMTELALDETRHDRMLHLTGGDIGARTEIAAVADRLREQPDPDLLTMCKLAMRRSRLTLRSANIPAGLPIAFARLGEHDRARSLANSIPDPEQRTASYIGLISVPRNAIDGDRDRLLAESLVRDIADPDTREELLTDLVAALLSVGDLDRAEYLAPDIHSTYRALRYLTDLVSARLAAGRRDAARSAFDDAAILAEQLVASDDQSTWALGWVAVAAAEIGEFDRADELTRRIASTATQAEVRATLCRILAHAGQADRAAEIADEVEHSEAVDHIYANPYITTTIVPKLVAAGFAPTARRIFVRARSQLAVPVPRRAGATALELINGLIGLGELDRAEAAARESDQPPLRVIALTGLVQALITAGRTDDARRIADEVETFAYQLPDALHQSHAFAAMVHALITAGKTDRAIAIASRIELPLNRAEALLALAIAEHGNPELAHQHAQRAQTLIMSLPESKPGGVPEDGLMHYWRAPHHMVARLVQTFARIGDIDHAIELADAVSAAETERFIDVAASDADDIAAWAAALLAVGRTEQAVRVVELIHTMGLRMRVLAELAEPMAEAGAADVVRQLLDQVAFLPAPERMDRTDTEVWNVAGTYLAIASARLGDTDLAQQRAQRLDAALDRSVAYTELVPALIESGDLERAAEVADATPAVPLRVHCLATVIPAIAERTGFEQANSLLEKAERIADAIEYQPERDEALGHLVHAVVAMGDTARAEALARRIDGLGRRVAALIEVAQALITDYATAPRNRAALRGIRRLLAEVWSDGEWFMPLDAVARFDTGLLIGITEDALASMAADTE
ncbi:caspase family protein [Nocardia sp. NPDC052566]|uniref:caspase, EACC1-associated type n=1 Tax=Nocardia sp. NPDC052566 TaxID=3364330 RepID=UPI0037CBD431